MKKNTPGPLRLPAGPRASILAFVMLMSLLLFLPAPSSGKSATGPAQNTYQTYINDEEDLLTDSQEEALLADMEKVTAYGHAAFISTKISDSDYEAATGRILHELFGSDSAIVFLIDMNHRQLVIFSDGAINKVISRRYANTITDNVYRMARDGDYYQCASEAFSEIAALLSGNKIAQPMRHITNALLALILSTTILYFITRRISRMQAAEPSEIFQAIGASCKLTEAQSTFKNRKKVYNPSSDSGGSFGGGGGGGGGGGSGGSHGF